MPCKHIVRSFCAASRRSSILTWPKFHNSHTAELVLQGHYQVWDKKNNVKRTSFYHFILDKQRKYMASAWERGGRQDFNFTFFPPFRPVSLILNFNAQKMDQVGIAELLFFCEWPYIIWLDSKTRLSVETVILNSSQVNWFQISLAINLSFQLIWKLIG